MSKRFKLIVLPKEKQLDNVKYALRIENPSILGNVYGLTELQSLINESLEQ